MSTIPSLTAPAIAFGIDDAGTTAATTFVFHDTLQYVLIEQKTDDLCTLLQSNNHSNLCTSKNKYRLLTFCN